MSCLLNRGFALGVSLYARIQTLESARPDGNPLFRPTAFVLPLFCFTSMEYHWPNWHRSSGHDDAQSQLGWRNRTGGRSEGRRIVRSQSCFNRDYCFLFARVRDLLYILQLNNLMLRGIRASVPRILICFPSRCRSRASDLDFVIDVFTQF